MKGEIFCIFICHMIGLKLERVLAAPRQTFEEQHQLGGERKDQRNLSPSNSVLSRNPALLAGARRARQPLMLVPYRLSLSLARTADPHPLSFPCFLPCPELQYPTWYNYLSRSWSVGETSYNFSCPRYWRDQRKSNTQIAS